MDDNSQMAVWDRIDFLRITAKPLNFFVALTSQNGRRYEFLYLTGLYKRGWRYPVNYSNSLLAS